MQAYPSTAGEAERARDQESRIGQGRCCQWNSG